ncbi:MAG: diguanylate cyclase [Geobacteraceae bacterium]|nr:diguanylate cyclase [Geobacteraceae bacterium]
MGEKVKILVVDDNRGMVKTICDILKAKGFESILAYSGEEAVEKVKADRPGCVLMDLRMPGIDGVKTLEQIRKVAPALPVLLITAYATEEQVEEAKRHGVSAVLTKPLDIQEFFCLLSQLGKGERHMVPAKGGSMSGKVQADSGETIRDRIRKEIIPVLYQVARINETKFHNPHLVCCWERKGCEMKDCPAYGNTEVRCWYRAGTYCGGKIQGTFVDKCGGCRQCDVFQESCPTVVEEVGEAANNLLFLLDEGKKASDKHLEKIEYLNKELLSALENLDSRNREIQELVITDKLTGLYNRNYLTTVLEDEIHRSQRGKNPLALMMIDLDDFKPINDAYGHSFGDKILAFLGSMLHGTIRKSDRPFRYGGEEFVVVLPDTDPTIALVVAERIREAFEKEPFVVEAFDEIQKKVYLTLSIGLATYGEGMTAGALIKQADLAIYKAKSEGKNRVIRYGID